MKYSRFFFMTVVLCLSSHLAKADDTSAKDDPRFLSEITLPAPRSCGSDVSNGGHFLYTICDSQSGLDGVTPSQEAKLYIHDISDLRSPHQVSVTDIGKIAGGRLIVRNGTAFYQQIANKGLTLIDVRQPSAPKVAGHIETEWGGGLRVSDDGYLVILKDAADKYKFIDTTNPYFPEEKKGLDSKYKDIITAPGKWKIADSAKIPGIDGMPSILDIKGTKALIMSPHESNLYQIYDLSVPNKPKLVATFPSEGGAGIIPDTNAVVVGGPQKQGEYTLQIIQAIDLPFDTQRLVNDYNEMSKKYVSCAGATTRSNECIHLQYYGMARLKDDGIRKLLSEKPAGLTDSQRLVMLNDYGFWLYKWKQNQEGLQDSETFLRKVIELAPDRDIAWLNLGDVLYTQIRFALTETKKADLWTEAKHSYQRYNDLTGKTAPNAAKLSAFDFAQDYQELEGRVRLYLLRIESGRA